MDSITLNSLVVIFQIRNEEDRASMSFTPYVSSSLSDNQGKEKQYPKISHQTTFMILVAHNITFFMVPYVWEIFLSCFHAHFP